jgi:hypothetical protein
MPVLLMILFLTVGTFGVGYLVTRYHLKRAKLMPSHKGLLVAVLAGASVALLFFIFRQFGINLFRGTARGIFEAVLVLVFLSIPAYMLLASLRSGSELADLGPSPLRTLLLLASGLLMVVCAGGLLTRSFSYGQAAVNMAQALSFAALGLSHSQIRSGGIYNGGGLLRWKRIARYESKNGDVLVVDLHRPRWWQDRVQLRVPTVLVEQVDRLMSQHLLQRDSS